MSDARRMLWPLLATGIRLIQTNQHIYIQDVFHRRSDDVIVFRQQQSRVAGCLPVQWLRQFWNRKAVLEQEKTVWALGSISLLDRRPGFCNLADSTSSTLCCPANPIPRSFTDAILTCGMPGAMLLVFCSTYSSSVMTSHLAMLTMSPSFLS